MLRAAQRLFGKLALGGAPAIAAAILMASNGIAHPPALAFGMMAFFVNSILILQDLRYGLAVFILAAGVSPKLPGIYDNLRLEDPIFAAVFSLWILQALQGKIRVTWNTPIILPFVVLTIMSIASTAWGMSINRIPDTTYSIFLQLKRIEYFLIFLVVATSVKNEIWVRLLAAVLVMGGAGAAIYGLATQSETTQAPAEQRVLGPEGENYNTLSGYLVICIMVGMAIIPSFRKGWMKLGIIAAITIAALGLLFSFSREGYIMLAVAASFFGLTRAKKMFLTAALAGVVLLISIPAARENINNTIDQIKRAPTDDPGSNSLTARYRAWSDGWYYRFLDQPLMGSGVASVALSIDNEYLLRACEGGVVGFSIFVWWLTAIGTQVRRLQRMRGLPELVGIGLGASFVGLLVQAGVAATFTTIRTMECFWFLLGIAAAAAAIQREQNRQAREAQEEPDPSSRRPTPIPRRAWA